MAKRKKFFGRPPIEAVKDKLESATNVAEAVKGDVAGFNGPLGEIDDGSPIPSTTRAAVYMRDVDVPPLPEQKAIASVLGALDDKIELNRRMNATLEAMARALFQSWFVDFDPVRAKLDNRQPIGLNKATADLFPEHFEHSDLLGREGPHLARFSRLFRRFSASRFH